MGEFFTEPITLDCCGIIPPKAYVYTGLKLPKSKHFSELFQKGKPMKVTKVEKYDDIIKVSVEPNNPLEPYPGYGKIDAASYIPCKIIYNGPATVVFWCDGTKTVVKRSENDPENRYSAFTAALAKKLYGCNSVINHIVECGVDEKK